MHEGICSLRRGFRALVVCAFTGAFLLALASAASALASGNYGQLLRFPGKGTNAGSPGTNFQFAGEEAHAFAVEPSSGRIFVGTESLESSEKLRIQSYSAAGAFEGAGLIKPPTLPAGIEAFEGYEGIATSTKGGRIYVLDVFKRDLEAPIDGDDGVAGALFALNSTPSAGKLEPAEGTGKEGLLGSTESLSGNSNVPGKALLEPSGITVDPHTGEILILGLIDEGAGALHTAVEHVSKTGAALFTWVDPEITSKSEEPDSPVVSEGGTLASEDGTLFFETGNQLLALPADAESGKPEVVFAFAEPKGLKTGPFAEELLSFGESGTGSGGGLAIAPGSSKSTGRLVAFAQIAEATPSGEAGETRGGALNLTYKEEGGHMSVAEEGWTGGQPGEGLPPEKIKPCEIGFAFANPLVAAAAGDEDYVLSPATGEVIEFGPGGEGCPTASETASGLEVTLEGKRVSNPEITDTVTLSAKVAQASVLSVQWIFGDGTEATIPTTSGEQTQTAETTHKFAKTGELTVEAIIHTDDLATPELHLKTAVDVTGTTGSPPKITREPHSLSLLEGETATFEAAASGEPTPTVQWEVSTNGGTNWTPLTGKTSDTLTLENVTVADNNNEYRAVFSNGDGGPVPSGAATLTVASKNSPPKITREPHSLSLLEGETASYEASATGEPSPDVQWEVSVDGGKDWTPLSGQTHDTLTLENVTVADNNNEYRAVFSNGDGGPVASTGATLTVESKQVHDQKEREANRQRELAEEAQKQAAAKQATEEAAAKKAAEEAAKKAGEAGHEVAGFKEGSPLATLASSSLSSSASGAVVIKVHCPTGVSQCGGTITLRTLTAVSARASAAKKSILTLAHGSFSVAGGQTQAITLHLSAQGRRLLAHTHTLRLQTIVVAHNASGESQTLQSTVTLRLSKHH